MPVRGRFAPPDVAAHNGGPASPAGSVRSLRIGGQTILPGESRTLGLGMRVGAQAADNIPVWAAVGHRPGPRVTIVAAPRGFEIVAARVAAGLRSLVDPAALAGALVVVPVLRPGGRFAARGQPLPDAAAWRFPGSPGGNRRAREAFGIFSELAVGSGVLVVLTAPEPHQVSVLTVRGDMQNSRVRRLALHAGAAVALDLKPAPGTLAAAAAEMGVAPLELCARSEATGDDDLLAAVQALLHATGVLPSAAAAPSSTLVSAPVVNQVTVVRAPQGGLLEHDIAVGQVVERGTLLARLVPPLSGGIVEVRAPHEGLVLEVNARQGVRARAALFRVGRVAAAALARHRKLHQDGAAPLTVPAQPEARTQGSGPALHVGWVESASLPALGVDRLRAKIDTGARTSALHVTRMKTVGTTDGPHHRPILEVTLPSGSRRGAAPVVVRVQVRDHVMVKDTSGRSERRPVIETTLRLGTIDRRIRVTLTNRGDMLFPMLIGRTALGPGVVVDPSRRMLLDSGRGGNAKVSDAILAEVQGEDGKVDR